jgi:HAD superfamily hydrolase (TIGR01509 family)
MEPTMIWLAQRLAIPATTQALLFDMDGVLIDSLYLDYEIADELMAPYGVAHVPHELIRHHFPLALDDFWRAIAADLGLTLPPGAVDHMVARHEEYRGEAVAPVQVGIVEILDSVRELGLPLAVVSNNPRVEVERMLAASGLLAKFDVVVGNDEGVLARKPAPDPYLAGAQRVGVPATACVAIEDSVLGLESGHRAGCYAVGVATSAHTFEAIEECGFADRCYVAFRPVVVKWAAGETTITTPDPMVSELIGVMAQAAQTPLEVDWTNNDWTALGHAVGSRIPAMPRHPRPGLSIVDGLTGPKKLFDLASAIAEWAGVAVELDRPEDGWTGVFERLGQRL